MQFAAWGTMLLGFALVIGAGSVATTAVLMVQPAESSVPVITAIHVVMFATLLGPAGFGMMWTAALLTIGLRLRRLGAATGSDAR